MEKKEPKMKGPYGFDLNENCQTCKLRGDGFFCQLPPAALKDLNAMKFVSAYPQDTILFMEKQTPLAWIIQDLSGEKRKDALKG